MTRKRPNDVDKEPHSQQQLLHETGSLTVHHVGRRVTPLWVLCPSCDATGWQLVDDRGTTIGVQCVTCHGGRLIRKEDN